MCKADKIDHGVLLVGYGEEKARWSKKILPYWIIKNSWGSSYGRKVSNYMKCYEHIHMKSNRVTITCTEEMVLVV